MVLMNHQPDPVNLNKRNRWIIVSLISRSSLLILILATVYLPGGSDRQLTSTDETRPDQSKVGSPEKLPNGLKRSDWNSIIKAHQAWKHSIKEDGKVWRAHNPGSGLTATFDGRGFDVRPESGDWSWGLELVSYGRGDQQISVTNRSADVSTTEQQINYQWNQNLQEWMKNHSNGLEHGYTMQQRPESLEESEPLKLYLRVRGELNATNVSKDGGSVTFGKDTNPSLLNYSGLTVFDGDGRSVEANILSKGNGVIIISVEDHQVHYPLTIDPLIRQQGYLKASNIGVGNSFGGSVSISGDSVIVGAIGESSNASGVNGNESDNSATASGAAYIFVRSGTTWSQQAYLKVSNAGAGDRFGYSVGISADTVIIGAWSEASNATGVNGDETDNSAEEAGAAYVFVRNGTTWSQQAYLKASNTSAKDRFGYSVAISVSFR